MYYFIESIWRKKSIVSICKYIILEIIRLKISNYVDSKKKVFNYTFNYLEVIKLFKILILFLIIIKKNIKLNSSLFVDWIYNRKNEQREELNNCC